MKLRFKNNLTSLAAPLAIALLLLQGCSSAEDDHAGHDDHEGEPAGAHSEDESHAGEEGHVELTEKQFQSAGIVVAAAAPGRVSEALTLPGAITPNADTVLHVTPRVAGQVRTALKHLGESVEAGELVCVIDSVDLGMAVADFLRDRERVTAAEETIAREHELYAGRLEALTAILEGAIAIQEHIYEREEELRAKAVSTIRPLLEADRAFRLAKFERSKQLTEFSAERDTRILALEVDLRTKRIDLVAATNRLRTLGLSQEELDELDESSPLVSGEYRIPAPGNGVIIDRHASNGEYVEAGAKLYIIEDLTSVWFVASVFEEQLQVVRTGQPARVSLDAFPGVTLDAEVSFLEYQVDPTSRSVGVRITLDNDQLSDWPEELPLRPGMFGRVELETDSRQAAVVIPESALVHEDAGDYVFIQVEPFAFERRDVAVKPVAGEMVEVISGLEPGEKVAISGTFLLKSAERQAELGGGHSH